MKNIHQKKKLAWVIMKFYIEYQLPFDILNQSIYPDLKWSTVNDWKKAVIAKIKRNYQTGQVDPITELESKKRERPAMWSDELYKDLQLYIKAIRTSGEVVNTAILIAAATGMLQVRDPAVMGVT